MYWSSTKSSTAISLKLKFEPTPKGPLTPYPPTLYTQILIVRIQENKK
jgi:hypothetical protein